MIPPAVPAAASTPEIIAVLEPALAKHLGESAHIVRLERRLSEYRSSFAIEELQLELPGGRHLSVMFKNLSSRALLKDASRTRPAFLYDPLREILVYQQMLTRCAVGTATCYATEVVPDQDRYWLFLERVLGLELYQVGDFAIWEQVAGWLARFHCLASELLPIAHGARLFEWNRERYQTTLEQAFLCVKHRAESTRADREVMKRLARIYNRVIDCLMGQPMAVIHGEFYASNVLVQEKADGIRICPIDWETAGIGPGLIDLAALVAGQWTDEERDALVSAYWNALEPRTQMRQPAESFRSALLCCRLHLAFQLLGRSPDWEPPPEHKRDWLSEAESLAAQLDW